MSPPLEIPPNAEQNPAPGTEEVFRQSACEVVEQLASLIDICTPLYSRKSPMSESTIGRHIRHVLDHLLVLRSSLESGHLNYNHRDRDSQLEINPHIAQQTTQDILAWLQQATLTNRKLCIETEISLNQYCNVTMDSNFYRELCYVINHSIHHLAYVKLIAVKEGLAIDQDIGLAPATVTYERKRKR